MIIDTHSHLNFKAYDNDREEVIKRNLENGVVCIDVGTKYETSKMAVELAESNENIFASIGMHPIHIKTDLLKIKMPARSAGGDEDEGAFVPFGEDFDKQKYLELAKSSKKIIAVGEVGLDYYYKPKSKIKQAQFKEQQKQVFIQQLEIAKELGLPVIVHSRMAFADTYEILKSYQLQVTSYKLQAVLHCFVGTVQEMQSYLDLGFYIGINGIIDKLNLDEVVKKCPIDRILTETDCPYLTPKVEGEKRNEPIFVKHVIQKIADLKGLTFDKVASATFTNAKSLFRI